MAFKFNFGSATTLPPASDSSDSCQGGTEREFTEVFPADLVTAGSRKVKVVGGFSVQCVAGGGQEEGGDGVDVVPGVYEGGFKVWEGSFDLINYLKQTKLCLEGHKVLDVGCGAGLLGIYCLLNGADAVHFQDYNPDVLETYTMGNVLLNLHTPHPPHPSQQSHPPPRDSSHPPPPHPPHPTPPHPPHPPHCALPMCRYFSGDWSCLTSHVKAGGGGSSLKYSLIVTAETIYSPSSYQKLHDLFDAALTPEGRVYVACKSHYFGVGGNVVDFIDYFNRQKIFKCEVVHSIHSGNGLKREILLVTRLV